MEIFRSSIRDKNIMETPYGIIYRARNIINGKVYIGQTKNKRFKYRIKEHVKNACDGKNSCPKFYRAIRKYGQDNFVWEIICECYNPVDLNKAEDIFIELYLYRKNSYNIRVRADAYINNTKKKKDNRSKRSSEWMISLHEKWREEGYLQHKNREPVSEETRNRMSESAKLRVERGEHNIFTTEQRLKGLETRRKMPLTEERSQKFSEAAKSSWTPERRASWSLKCKEMYKEGKLKNPNVNFKKS